ncbi:hypothetical protein [Trujillonella humicola]|uniref:hypothetical protein n=1 Tax=Trujillonella humicola TaxID=3383699 RepID=UPI003905FF72
MSEPTAPPVPSQPTGPIPPYFGPAGRSAQEASQPRNGGQAGEAGTAEAPASEAPTAEAQLPPPAGPATGPEPTGPHAAGATASGAPAAGRAAGEPPTRVGPAAPDTEPAGGAVAAWALTDDDAAGPDDPASPRPAAFPTTPVSSRPSIRARRRDPLTRMGPWAPAAGALLGLVAGLVVVALLGGRADVFSEGLALVFLVVGLTMLGAAGALLADEVRLVRRGAREAAVRPAWVEATSNLLNGLTPARLLLGSSAFVLFLAAYVGR